MTDHQHDPATFAERLRLRYVENGVPGISRRRRGRGWSYHLPDGTLLEGDQRRRCVELTIPPAWQEVWICPWEDGHLQAWGLDDAERRQSRYHPRWVEGRRLANFDRMRGMADRLATLRRRLDQLLEDGRDEVTRATAAMVRLVDTGLARIGGPRSAEEFGHFGVSTLRRDHVDIEGTTVRLDYPAKGGVEREVEVDNPLLAEVLQQLELASEHLFNIWGPHGEHTLTAADANRLLAELTGGRITCKDFRTWGGSAIALQARVEGAGEVDAVDAAADALDNTRAVARSSYVHPDVLTADPDELHAAWGRSRSSNRFDRRERALARFLSDQPPLLEGWLRSVA